MVVKVDTDNEYEFAHDMQVLLDWYSYSCLFPTFRFYTLYIFVGRKPRLLCYHVHFSSTHFVSKMLITAPRAVDNVLKLHDT